MANTPIYNMTDTWNAGATTFNAIKMSVTDTASAAGSKLLDLLVGGSSKFSVNKAGNVAAAGTLTVTGASTLAALGATNGTFSGTLGVTGATTLAALSATTGAFSGNLAVATDKFTVAAATGNTVVAGTLGVTGNTTLSGTLGVGAGDCILLREAANALAMRNGTNAQTLRLYNTYTDGSDYERLSVGFSASFVAIDSQAAGTGTLRPIVLRTGGNRRFAVGSNGVHCGGMDLNDGAIPSVPLYIERATNGFNAGVENIPLYIQHRQNANGQATGIAFGVTQAFGYVGAKILHYRDSGASVGGLVFCTRSDTGTVGVDFDLSVERMRITAAGALGIGTTIPGRRLDVNDASGNCLRLTHNDADGSATNFCDLLVSSGGDLTIDPSGGDVKIDGTVETAAPSGGTAAKWKLGTVASVSPTSPDRTIEVEIGGTTYYLSAKTTND